MIAQTIAGNSLDIPVMTLKLDLEQLLLGLVAQTKQNGGFDKDVVIELGAERLQKSVAEVMKNQEVSGQSPVLLVASNLRVFLSRFLRVQMPRFIYLKTIFLKN